jgi:threonine/homoserine/homoserine lactone efflux protein
VEFSHWLSLFSICLLGAMSPGPSLAVVMGAALHGGRGAGFACAVAHGAGVGLYGLLTVTGLAVVVTRSPGLFLAIQLAGAIYLLYLGARSLRSGRGPALPADDSAYIGRRPAVDGFLVAFLNPKLAVFMLALFSQFLHAGADALEKGIMAATVGITDALWYSLVVLLITRPAFLDRLRAGGRVIDRAFGVILVLLALTVMARAVL